MVVLALVRLVGDSRGPDAPGCVVPLLAVEDRGRVEDDAMFRGDGALFLELFPEPEARFLRNRRQGPHAV